MASSNTAPGGTNGPDVATLRQIMANAFDIDDDLSFGAVLRSTTLLEEDSQHGPARVAMGDMSSSSFGGGEGGEGGRRFEDEIERMFTEIRHLKTQIIAWDTLDFFEQGILRNKVVSTNESLREDGLQRSAKEALQKVKAERRELYDSGLKKEVDTLVDSLSARAGARSALNDDIDLVSAVAKARHVEDYLFNNSDSNHNKDLRGTKNNDHNNGAQTLRAQQQKLNRQMAIIDGNAGDMSLSTCQRVMDDLQESFDALATAHHDVSNRVAGLRDELVAGETRVAQRRATLTDVQARVNLFESRCGGDAAAVRQHRELVATHRETARFLRALSALHLREMRADGMSFIVDTATLLPVVPDGGGDGNGTAGLERERERVSHVVDVVFDTRRADGQAAKIAALVERFAAMRGRGSAHVAGGEGQDANDDGVDALTLKALFNATDGAQTAGLIVLDVVVEPCDVQLDVRGMSLEWALRLLLPELRRATYDRAMATATMTNMTMTA